MFFFLVWVGVGVVFYFVWFLLVWGCCGGVFFRFGCGVLFVVVVFVLL